MSSSATPRRSQRIASKNAASVAAPKESSTPCNSIAFTILTGPGQSGKSPLRGMVQEMMQDEFFPRPKSRWGLDYALFRADIDMNNPRVVHDLVTNHERIRQGDADYAKENCNSQWEKELTVAARWLCTDNRLLTATPQMIAKATRYAWLVNNSFPALYAQIECLEKQLPTLKGYAADCTLLQLFEFKLLLQLANHVHEKWIMAMSEFREDQNALEKAMEAECECDTCQNLNVREPFKPEMSPYSDDEDY